MGTCSLCGKPGFCWSQADAWDEASNGPLSLPNESAIAQLKEHLAVETCSNQMVPGSIPGGRTFSKPESPRGRGSQDADFHV